MKRSLSLTALLLASLSTPAEAGQVYNNTTNWTGSNAILSGAEWGDDVHLTSAGNMSEFQFGYGSNGATQATVRFYVNDATNTTLPVTGNAFHTEVVSIPGGGSSGLKTVLLGSPVAVPNDLWITIQYNGNSAQVPLYDPPTVGSSDSGMVVHVSSGTAGNLLGGNRNSFQLSVTIADVSPWTDLGHGLAGTNGVPSLTGSGSLAGGTSFGLTLSSARPNTTAFLVLGLARIDQPFAGGVLVPRLDEFIPLPTNASGGLVLNGTVPGGTPSGVDLFFQYWIVDPAGPFGKAASNGLQGTTP